MPDRNEPRECVCAQDIMVDGGLERRYNPRCEWCNGTVRVWPKVDGEFVREVSGQLLAIALGLEFPPRGWFRLIAQPLPAQPEKDDPNAR